MFDEYSQEEQNLNQLLTFPITFSMKLSTSSFGADLKVRDILYLKKPSEWYCLRGSLCQHEKLKALRSSSEPFDFERKSTPDSSISAQRTESEVLAFGPTRSASSVAAFSHKSIFITWACPTLGFHVLRPIFYLCFMIKYFLFV